MKTKAPKMCPVCQEQPIKRNQLTCSRTCGSIHGSDTKERTGTGNYEPWNRAAVAGTAKAFKVRFMAYLKAQLADLAAASTDGQRAAVLTRCYMRGRSDERSRSFYRLVQAPREKAERQRMRSA